MTNTIRFHLDENVNLAVAKGLRQRGIDVTTTQGAGLLGVSDEEHLAFAMSEGRVVFSGDTDFLILASRVKQHAGIVYARKGTRSVREIIDGLELIFQIMSPTEMRGHIEFI